MTNPKMLWHSNAPWAPTGYGQQTALFAPHLKEHYDLAISAFYGLDGSKLVWDGIPVYPGCGQDFGNSFLFHHAKDFFGDPKDGLVVTLLDIWTLSPDLAKGLNLAAWVPIDHEPPIPPVLKFFHESGSVPIAMSRFGQQQLKDANLDPLYVPHGVDTEVYYQRDKAEVRKNVGIPEDAYLVGMVAANKGNPSRKGFQQAFQAFRVFQEKHPEAILYLHTTADPRVAAGEDLKAELAALGITDGIVYAPPYRMLFDPFPANTMAQIYSTMDMLLNPSMGEGFGIPVLEAAACGVPSIVTNFSAMPEVAGDAGWKVGCRPFWTNGKSWQAMADVPEIVDALEQHYAESTGERHKRSMAVREHALTYDVRRVLDEYMLPALETAQQRFGARKPEVIRQDLAAA